MSDCMFSTSEACLAYRKRKIFGVIYQDHVLKTKLSFSDALSYIGQFLVDGQRAYIYDCLSLAVWLYEMKDNVLQLYDGEVVFAFRVISDDFYHYTPDYAAASLYPWEV